MSRTIDERIVSMEFDNRQFEKNVATSMNTLDKLKEKLNLSGASKGLEEVGNAANKQRNVLDELEVTSTKAGLSMRDIWIKTASIFEYQVAGRIISAAKNLVKSLTIDPVKTGLSEYETQMGAIQTILANTESKGTTLDDVNEALDTLNAYADKTIYNFTQMTKNIGTFTAAGIDLDTSVSAIQGIANLAAVSGSTSQQASTAMYQLSQALASGTVKLMDWNSVVNAGMGGEVFQNALKETARVHGVAVDDIIKKQGSFRESLSEGWITSEILTETLKHFTMAAEEGSTEWKNYKETLKSEGYTEKQAEEILRMANTATAAATEVKTFTQLLDTLKESAQSGWAQSWELIVGDFEEAKKLWTSVSNTIGGMIGDSADFRNKLLSGSLSSGWQQFLGEGVVNESGYQNWIKSIVQDTKNINMDDLIKDGKTFEDVLRDLINSGDITSDTLSQALNELAKEAANYDEKALSTLGITKEQRDAFLKLNDEIQNGSGILGEYTDKMGKLSGKQLIIESIVNLWNALNKLIEPVKKALNEIFPATAVENVKDTAEGIYGLIQRFHEFTASIEISDETLDKIRRTFKGVFAAVDIVFTILKALGSLIAKITGNSGGLIDVILTITAKLGDAIVKLRDFIKDSESMQKVVNVLRDVFKFLAKIVTDFSGAMGDLEEQFKNLDISWLTDALTILLEVLKYVWDMAKVILDKLKTAFENTFNGEGFSLDTILKMFATGALGALFVKLVKFIKGFEELKSKFVGGLANFLGEIKDAFYEFQMQNLKMNAFKNLAIAIGILVASLLVLTLIDQDKLTVAVATLLGIIITLLAAFKFLSKLEFKDAKEFKKATKTLITMSIALLIAAFAIKKLGNMDWATWGRGLMGMAFTLATLIGCLWLIKQMDITGENTNKALVHLAVMSGILVITAFAIKKLGSMDWATWGRGLIGMTATLSTLIGCLWLMKKMNINGGKRANRGLFNLAAISSILIIIAVAIKQLGSMEWDTWGRGLIGMAASLATLIGCLWLMKKMKVGDTKGVEKVLALAGTLVVVGVAMKILGSMSWAQFAVSISAMSSALAVLIGSLWVLKVVDVDIKGALALLAMCPTLLAIAGVMKILGTMAWGEYAVAIAAMASTITILVGAMAIMSLLKGNNVLAASGGLAIMAAAIGMLVPSIMLLGSLNTGTLIQGVAAVAGVLLILAGACALLSKYQKMLMSVGGAVALLGVGCAAAGVGIMFLATGLDILIDAIVEGGPAFVEGLIAIINGIADAIPHIMQKLGEGIVALCGAIADGAPAIRDAFIAIIKSLCQALIESSSDIAEAIVVTLTDLNEAIVKVVPTIVEGLARIILKVLELLVEYVPQFVDKIFDLVIKLIETLASRIPDLNSALVGLLTSFFMGIADALKQVDPTILSEGIQAVAFLGVLMAGLAAVAGLVPAAMLGVIGMGVVLAELSFVMAALGKLSKIEGLKEAIKDGGGLLGAIGYAIGSFIGNLAGAIGEGVSSSLPTIADDLSAFMKNLTPFLEGIKSLDATALENAKTLVGVMLTITAANVIESIASFITGTSSMAKFAEDLNVFGKGLADFSNQVKGIDINSVTAAADAGEALADMANSIPLTGGIRSWFEGETKFGEFGNQLGDFGKGIRQFADHVKGIDVNSVTAAANAGKVLAEMANGIPLSGGVKSWIEGENTLSDFGNQLPGFGKGIASFGNNVKGVNPAAITAAANAGATLAEMASEIPNQGGIVTWFSGDNKMADFATGLASMGEGIRSFAFKTTGLSLESINVGVAAGNAIIKMAKEIPNQGGMVTWFAGDNKMTDFATGLASLATGICNFGDTISSVNLDGIKTGVSAARSLISMANSMPTTGGIKSWFTGDNSMNRFAENLADLGWGINEFSTAINASTISSAAESVSNLIDSINALSIDTVNTMRDVFINSEGSLSIAFDDMFNSIVSAAVFNFAELKSVTIKSMLNFSSTIESFKPIITTTFKGVLSGISEAPYELQSNLYSAGSYLVQGFANGIADSSYLAEAKAKAVATAAKDAINDALGIESPSKELYQSGVYSIEGYANALMDYAYKAYDAGANVGEQAKTGLSSVIQRITDAIESDVDTNPTIRPVLDLSEVNNGLNTMNGMFDLSPSMGVMARVNSINSSMNKNQNGGNTEVVSAINGLKDTMKNTSGDTYNINGVTYSDGSEIQSAIETIVRAIIRERRS